MKIRQIMRFAGLTITVFSLLLCFAGNLYANMQFEGDGKIISVRTSYDNNKHVCTATLRPSNSHMSTTSFTIITPIVPDTLTTAVVRKRLIRLSMCEALMYAMELDRVKIRYMPNVNNTHSLLALEIDGYGYDESRNSTHDTYWATVTGPVKIFLIRDDNNPESPLTFGQACKAHIKLDDEDAAPPITFSIGDSAPSSFAARNACSALARAFASRKTVNVKRTTYQVQITGAPFTQPIMRPNRTR